MSALKQIKWIDEHVKLMNLSRERENILKDASMKDDQLLKMKAPISQDQLKESVDNFYRAWRAFSSNGDNFIDNDGNGSFGYLTPDKEKKFFINEQESVYDCYYCGTKNIRDFSNPKHIFNYDPEFANAKVLKAIKLLREDIMNTALIPSNNQTFATLHREFHNAEKLRPFCFYIDILRDELNHPFIEELSRKTSEKKIRKFLELLVTVDQLLDAWPENMNMQSCFVQLMRKLRAVGDFLNAKRAPYRADWCCIDPKNKRGWHFKSNSHHLKEFRDLMKIRLSEINYVESIYKLDEKYKCGKVLCQLTEQIGMTINDEKRYEMFYDDLENNQAYKCASCGQFIEFDTLKPDYQLHYYPEVANAKVEKAIGFIKQNISGLMIQNFGAACPVEYYLSAVRNKGANLVYPKEETSEKEKTLFKNIAHLELLLKDWLTNSNHSLFLEIMQKSNDVLAFLFRLRFGIEVSLSSYMYCQNTVGWHFPSDDVSRACHGKEIL